VAACSQFDVTCSNGVFEGDMKTSSSAFVGEACSFSQAVREAVQLGLTEEVNLTMCYFPLPSVVS
jgi:hypothetical protein